MTDAEPWSQAIFAFVTCAVEVNRFPALSLNLIIMMPLWAPGSRVPTLKVYSSFAVTLQLVHCELPLLNTVRRRAGPIPPEMFAESAMGPAVVLLTGVACAAGVAGGAVASGGAAEAAGGEPADDAVGAAAVVGVRAAGRAAVAADTVSVAGEGTEAGSGPVVASK